MMLTLGTMALKTLPCNEESTDMQMSQVVLILKTLSFAFQTHSYIMLGNESSDRV